MLDERGNTFIEYFVLSLTVIAATIWLFDQGNFRGVRQTVQTSFENLIGEIAK